jgi:hypothetical protein
MKTKTESPPERQVELPAGEGLASPPCSALWVNCVGCCASTIKSCATAGQCEKRPEWKSPTTPQELEAYAEAMSCAIFRSRKEIKRLQGHVDAMEPIFGQLLNLEQNSQDHAPA